ncbi:MAG TPA: TolC family protein [Bacteroidales bacterium]|nr:TolC family protein [Bacteroidales bacterium]HPS61956.1 TolC family protein [Bacteroidales bacterium]
MKRYSWLFILLPLFGGWQSLPAQTGARPLSLDSAIARVVASHPSVRQAAEALSVADQRILLARSTRMPVVSGNAGYTRIGPVPEITIPGMGSFRMAPNNNYSVSVEVGETLYDFGKTKKNTEIEEAGRVQSEQSLKAVIRRLEMATVQVYCALVYDDHALAIKEEQLKNLKDHLDFLEKKNEAGTATRYDLLSTRVKISRAENEKTDLETLRQDQATTLNILMGAAPEAELVVEKAFSTPAVPASYDSLVQYAFLHREDLLMAKQAEKISGLQYDLVRIKRNPTLSLFASGGIKNGYFPDLNNPIANYAAGISFKAPIIDGFRKSKDLSVARSGMNQATFETDRVKRQAGIEIMDSYTQSLSAEKKIGQGQLQVEQAAMALSLAQVNFRAGTITNLDLLDSETSLAESRLSLLKSELDYSLSLYRLRNAIGVPLSE